MSRFYTAEDLQILTGRKTKAGQIEYLRREGIAFRVNALGCPVVAITAVEGKIGRAAQDDAPMWQPPSTIKAVRFG